MDSPPLSNSNPGSPLSEENIRHISRSIRSYVPSAATDTSTHDDHLKEFENLLDQVLSTSAFPALTATHRVSAWNTLCSLIDQALDADLPQVRELIWSSDVWNRALEVYICHAQTARPKSSRQMLITLTVALKKAPLDAQADLKWLAVQRLVRCLLDFEYPFQAKASAQLLGHLLTKDVIDVENVLLSFSQVRFTESAATLEKTAAFLELLFEWLGKGDFGSTIAQLVTAVLDKSPAKDASDRPIWVLPLEQAYLRNSANVDDLRAHIFPTLFKRSFPEFAAFLQSEGLDKLMEPQNLIQFSSKTTNELLLSALQTGKELGMLLETDENKLTYNSPSVLVPVQLISRLLLQRSRSARLTGLSLLINSPMITRPLSATALNLARRSFGIFFADVDADFRSEVFGAFSRLIDRIRAVSAALARQTTQRKMQDSDPTASNTALKCHQDFVRRILRFLTWELRPTASYQRHISALKCISILVRSGIDQHVPAEFYSKAAQGDTKWAFRLQVLTKDLQRLLLDTLLDPFDDVRATASAILGYYCSTVVASGMLQQAQLASTLERAEAMMLATGRADHADGVAHLYSICYRRCGKEDSCPNDGFWSSRDQFSLHLVQKLERMLVSAKHNLGDAVENYPMHGLLTSLRYVLHHDLSGAEVELQLRLFEYLREVWDVVKPMLCNDAPEGHIPEELEDSPESTKESLSYCWRALKEASLLLSSLISTQSVSENAEILHGMSRLCFTQLAELRHRGAFSTVAQTWQSCCMRCKDLRNTAGTLMLEVWYLDVLEILRNNVTINTRRSAGLPSLLCGILVADRSGTLLSRAFVDLVVIARKDVDATSAEEGSLAQVHAMNCLKDILKNTSLGEQTQHYVPTALQLAADALRSEVWGVRNCGLMLFRAVIDRLLGTNGSHFEDDLVLQKRISAEQHPALLDVVLGLLPRPTVAQDTSIRYESVFPALQLLQHTRIPSGRLEEIRTAVRALNTSPAWHVRDKAARTFASLVDREQIPLHLAKLLGAEVTSHNALHGSLLTVKYIMIHARRATAHLIAQQGAMTEDQAESHEDYSRIVEIVASIYHTTPAVVTKAACVDVLRECCAYLTQIEESNQNTTHHELFFAFVDVSLHEQGAAAIYTNILTQCLYDTTDAVLRQAWARYAAHHVASYKLGTNKEAESFSHALFELAHRDEDAASYFLISSNWNVMRNGGKGNLVMDLCTKVLASEDLSIALKCEAQRTMLGLLSKNPSMTPELQEVLRNATADRLYLSRQDCNQQYVDRLLELQAVSFESSSGQQNLSNGAENLIAWADDCISAVKGTGVHRREAAADALDRLDSTWALLANQESLATSFRGLCSAVYDLLNDDDEDVRLLAAGITSRILSQTTAQRDVDFEPIVAGQKLLALYTSCAERSPERLPIALARAYGFSSGTRTIPVAEQLVQLSHSDTALFAQEKQNLYIDDAQEVRVWSQVAGKIFAEHGLATVQDEHTASAIGQIAIELADWVSNGLDALTRRAEGEPDGALGWTTTEDVFALGLRVIHGSEVVLQMKARGVPVPALETKLFACSKAFESGGVNCLWSWEVERV